MNADKMLTPVKEEKSEFAHTPMVDGLFELTSEKELKQDESPREVEGYFENIKNILDDAEQLLEKTDSKVTPTSDQSITAKFNF